MKKLGAFERVVLHFHIRRAVHDGQLPQQTMGLLQNPDFSSMLEDGVSGQYEQMAAAGAGAGGTLIQFIIGHWQQILQFILQILPLFGVPVPPITIPKPTPAPAPGVVTTALEMPTAFSLPPGSGSLIAEILQALLPLIEEAIKKHIPGGAT